MDDFAYDSVQKKKLAKNAIHKKNGSKSKKCSLPSDGMSRKEWEEMNGDVKKYRLNEPMSWAQFKEMPLDLQQEYLNFLVSNFKVGAYILSNMFGIDARVIKKWIREHDMWVEFSNSGSLTNLEKKKRDCFIAGEDWTVVNSSVGVMSWEGFKMLSREEQQSYLQDLVDTQKVSQNRIAEAMGIRGTTLSGYCKSNQIDICWRGRIPYIPIENCPDFDVLENPRPISWGQFKALPRETQGKYLQKLIDNYGGTTLSLGAMFGIAATTVSGYVKYHNLDVSFKPKGSRSSVEDHERWECFLAGKEHQEPTEAIDITEPEPITTDAIEKEEPEITTDISITMKGDINIDELVSMMRSLLGDSSRGTLNFTFKKEETV